MVILIACGLQREARILGGPGVMPVIGGGDAAALEDQLEGQIGRLPPISLILSCGIAGALDPGLVAGDIIIDDPYSRESGNPAPEGVSPAALGPRFCGGTGERLGAVLPLARHGAIIGQDHIAASAAEKAALFAATGALAVDMESHIAARVAERHGLPFMAIRTISDCAHEALPPAALVGMNPDGSMALGRVLASLARRPGQLPALIRTGRSAEKAFTALRQVAAAIAGLARD
ncbi:MAG: phosphorylase [Novosphingobium sp.]|nr:phosphorylase [Novosphingobium sp.]